MEEGVVLFYVWGITEEAFEEYRNMYSDFTLVKVETEDNSITGYYYERDGICVAMAYYLHEDYNTYLLEVYVYYTED